MDRPSRTKSHPAGSLSSSQLGGPPRLASALAFGLIVRIIDQKASKIVINTEQLVIGSRLAEMWPCGLVVLEFRFATYINNERNKVQKGCWSVSACD
jgi:hypothetical protein